MSKQKAIAVILLAAGSGQRMRSDRPKQYLEVQGKSLIIHCLESLAKESRIRWLQPVLAADDVLFASLVSQRDWPFQILPAVQGGSVREASMANGLAALPAEIEWVAVHDAARALPSKALLQVLFDAMFVHGAAVPGIAVSDTIKRIDAKGMVLETPHRAALRAIQTPQAAKREWLEAAVQQQAGQLAEHTDDASLLEASCFPVHVCAGDVNNRKMTIPEDLQWMATYLA